MKLLNVSKENALFQEILALKNNRNKRNSMKKFFVEGVQNIKNAIDNGWVIDSFIYTEYNLLSDWAKSVLKKAKTNVVISSNLMEKLSDKDEISELLAIVEMKEQKNILNCDNPLIVLVDRPSKKGNLGSIIRSCDALYVDCIYYSGHAVDIYDHNVITSSMGSFFRVPFQFIGSNTEFEEVVENLRRRYDDFQVVGTSLQTNDGLYDCDFKKPTMLLVGNEAMGLSKYYVEKADRLVKIDMRDGIDSLNVACATTACLYEINRQRNS